MWFLALANRGQERRDPLRLGHRGQVVPAPAGSPSQGWAARGHPLAAARQEHRQVEQRERYAEQPR